MSEYIESYIRQPEVAAYIEQLEKKFGKKGENLVVSDVLDNEGHQYVDLVQKGGGVLGVALIGYTYILEQMNIRFVRLAGTSAGAINTALMTVIGEKNQEKSQAILENIGKLNFLDLVDGHPAAKWLITHFVSAGGEKQTTTSKAQRTKKIRTAAIALGLLPLAALLSMGFESQFPFISPLTIALFLATGFLVLIAAILAAYVSYLVKRLKESGFGVNPGTFFLRWITGLLHQNGVDTVSQLNEKAAKPIPGLHHRDPAKNTLLADLRGDVTFIASEVVTENKFEFPRMANYFRPNAQVDDLLPAGFVRASMAIPIFFESWFINDIPVDLQEIKDRWAELGVTEPPVAARFVDGGLLSNFPINIFYNAALRTPRLPSFGIDLDDTLDPKVLQEECMQPEKHRTDGDDTNHPDRWSIGGFIYRMFNTSRYYYDKDFLLKNGFFQRGIGHIPLKGFDWLKFSITEAEKKKMFVLGAHTAMKFLLEFNWDKYKIERETMYDSITKPSEAPKS